MQDALHNKIDQFIVKVATVHLCFCLNIAFLGAYMQQKYLANTYVKLLWEIINIAHVFYRFN